MPNDIKTKEITIEGFEVKNGRYSVIDQDNQRYSFFTQWEGQNTEPYDQWVNMQLGQGKNVRINYVEKTGTNAKTGKPVTYKNIYSFLEPPQDSAPVPKGVQDDYGRRLAIHGFVNGMLASGASVKLITESLTALLILEDRINEALNGKKVDEVEVDEDGVPF